MTVDPTRRFKRRTSFCTTSSTRRPKHAAISRLGTREDLEVRQRIFVWRNLALSPLFHELLINLSRFSPSGVERFMLDKPSAKSLDSKALRNKSVCARSFCVVTVKPVLKPTIAALKQLIGSSNFICDTGWWIMSNVDELKDKLATAVQILRWELADMWGHVSCRSPGGDSFLIMPVRPPFDHDLPDDEILEYDLDGKMISGRRDPPAENFFSLLCTENAPIPVR